MEQAALTMYEMAKQMVANETPLDPIQFNRIISDVSNQMEKNSYYLLLCPDLRQYVFLHINESTTNENIQKELSDILLNRGKILLIDDDAADKQIWEFWLQDKYDEQIYMYQLVNYTEQTVEV